MTPIASTDNPKLKQLRKLLGQPRERSKSGLFAAEGEDLVLAARAAGREPVYGFHAAGAALELDLAGFEALAPQLLAGVSALGSGSRIVGVYEQRFAPLPKGGLCVYLHSVGDPGNVGTILRSALAFGASSVALGPGCADPHSPKAVRASMGAIFSVALARADSPDELPGERVALVAGAGEPLWQVAQALVRGAAGDPKPGGEGASAAATLLIGAERDGLPASVVEACEHVAHIPIAGDSLNAAMAATVALYEMSSRVPPR
jgi:TrmH family RNA methyltransferase